MTFLGKHSLAQELSKLGAALQFPAHRPVHTYQPVYYFRTST